MEALGILFQLHHQAVFRTAYGITRNQDLAEEITQKVFIELFTAIKRYDPRRPFFPWLQRIAVYKSLDELRKLRRTTDRDAPIPDGDDPPEPGPDPEKCVLDKELRAIIWAAVGNLSPKHRAVVVMYYYQDFSVAEISKTLGCLPKTVRTRLHYARARLREVFEAREVLKWREPPYDPGPKLPPPPSAQNWPIQTFSNSDERRVKSPVLSSQRKVR